jgi:hypothetical protein
LVKVEPEDEASGSLANVRKRPMSIRQDDSSDDNSFDDAFFAQGPILRNSLSAEKIFARIF